MALDYFYDAQLRRYWTQFVRIFEGFQYRTGRNGSGQVSMRTVPVKLASKDRLVGHILRNNSENTTMSTPQISCWMNSLSRVPARTQSPNFTSTVNVWERAIDPVTNSYTGEAGRSYTVERMMGVPYDMMMNVDIWTSNEDQKSQLVEQILQLFNPSIDMQISDNPLDWNGLGIVEHEGIEWSSRSFPIGTEDDIDITTLTFRVPIWISPPAKVKRQNIIQQIITNITAVPTIEANEGVVADTHYSEADMRSRLVVTPGDYHVDLSGSVATLLTSSQSLTDDEGNELDWAKVLGLYGKVRPGISQIRFKTTGDLENHDNDVIGTFDLDYEVNKMNITFDFETLPTNTLAGIKGVVDPHLNHPGNTTPLTSPMVGDRWMILNDIAANTTWGAFTASENDIIQFTNTGWSVVFDASATDTVARLTHTTTGVQYKWTGGEWVNSLEGVYRPGYFRVFL